VERRERWRRRGVRVPPVRGDASLAVQIQASSPHHHAIEIDGSSSTRGRGGEGGTRAGEADVAHGGGLGGDDDEAVQARLARREEVLQSPLQRVRAGLALVQAHHHGHLPCRRRGC
jgi:hypothetical protein